jgi:hypothetical protein
MNTPYDQTELLAEFISIACIVLVQLNYALAPRIPLLSRLTT